MDWLVTTSNDIWAWFGIEDNQNRVQAIAAVAAVSITILSVVLGAIWFIFTKLIAGRPVPDAQEPTAVASRAGHLTLDQHLAILDKREEQLIQRLAAVHEDEKTILRKQLEELQSQRAYPEKSLAEARQRIADLETRLEREGNDIGGDRIAEARAALEQGDYSIADDIFAEIEARQDIEVQRAARAAYGRGEVAEAEIRWADAAAHYDKAARLHPSFGNLLKAREFAWRSGDYPAALHHGEDLVALARAQASRGHLAVALNEHAITLVAAGRFAEAEPLFREALEIHRQTLGARHPKTAAHLNNLAGLLQDTGRFAEAEPLYREALEIDREALGERHPDQAISLVNLGSLLVQRGEVSEAHAMLKLALEIFRATLPDDHPYIAETLAHLAGLPEQED